MEKLENFLTYCENIFRIEWLIISKLNNISNLKEKVLIVIPIINNYKIFKDSFYNKNNLENRKSETISLVRALNVNVLDVLTIKINKFSSAYLFNKNSLD